MISLFNFYRIIIILFLFIIGSGSNIWASPIYEVLKYVKTNNPEIRLAKQELKLAQIDFKSSISNFLPNVQTSFQQGKQQNNAKNVDRGNLDKLQDLETYTLTITQPIFKGFQNYNNYKIAEQKFNEAKAKFLETENNLFLKTIRIYINLAQSEANIKLIKQKLKYQHQELDIISSRIKNGYAEKTEKLSVQIKINISNEELKEAELIHDNNIQKYLELVGKIDTNLDINSIPTILGAADLAEILTKSYEQNLTILQDKLKLDQTKSEYQKAKGKFAPEANIVFQKQNQQNMAYINNRDLDSTSYYIEVSLPLFQQGSEYFGLKRARETQNLAETKLMITQNKLTTDITNKFQQIHFSKNKLDNLEQKLWLYKQQLKQEELLVEKGQTDKISELKIKAELTEIQQELISTKSNYIFYHQELKLLKGANLL